MTSRQRENAAKYLYDLSKILFATMVVGNLLAADQFDMLLFVLGGVIAVVFIWWGYALDGMED